MTVIANQTDRLTKDQFITTEQTISFLRERGLRLHVSRSKDRYICRIVDKDKNVVSLSSRTVLEEAVTIAIGNVRDFEEVPV